MRNHHEIEDQLDHTKTPHCPSQKSPTHVRTSYLETAKTAIISVITLDKSSHATPARLDHSFRLLQDSSLVRPDQHLRHGDGFLLLDLHVPEPALHVQTPRRWNTLHNR